MAVSSFALPPGGLPVEKASHTQPFPNFSVFPSSCSSYTSTELRAIWQRQEKQAAVRGCCRCLSKDSGSAQEGNGHGENRGASDSKRKGKRPHVVDNGFASQHREGMGADEFRAGGGSAPDSSLTRRTAGGSHQPAKDHSKFELPKAKPTEGDSSGRRLTLEPQWRDVFPQYMSSAMKDKPSNNGALNGKFSPPPSSSPASSPDAARHADARAQDDQTGGASINQGTDRRNGGCFSTGTMSNAGNREGDARNMSLSSGFKARNNEGGPCMSVSDSGLIFGDPVWAAIRSEARIEAEREPLLSSFLYASILAHSCFERSLGFVLANRLQNATLLATQLMDVFDDVLMTESIRLAIRADVQAVKDRDPSCHSYSCALLYFKGYHALQAYRIAHVLWNRGQKVLALALQSRMSEVFAVDIHPAARIGSGILLDHGTGVVVGETAVIGDHVSLLQGVTLGGTGKEAGDRHPKIEAGVLLGAGATVLGNIRIGQGSMVAAGSLVLKSVPPHSLVAGTPAKIVGALSEQTPALTMNHDAVSCGMVELETVQASVSFSSQSMEEMFNGSGI
eukprot:TRINITY_DN1210_c0_g1_i3.p1 TRINITY_DN1210_c0_g1~~TRINITY_DN1210_c0_g1_i3.p1  ORF type:complete len:564 (+),score=87.89 TRINITY_DN1210_c0_g1_i3:3-1694(+)